MGLFTPDPTFGVLRTRRPPASITSTSATPTSAAVASVADVPAVSILISATVAAVAVAAVAAVPAPSLSTSVTVTPAAVAAVASVPTPAFSTSSTVTATAVAAVAAVPAPAGVGPLSHNETVFTGLTPAVGDAADAVSYTLGTLITSDADGSIIGVRWYFPTQSPGGTVIGVVYSYDSETSGTELARANFVNPTLGDWNTAIFASPVAMTATTKYVAAVWTPLRYVYTLNGLDSSIVNGHLTAPANQAGVQRNGRFDFASSSTGPAYPAGGGGTNYFADLLVLYGSPVTATPTPATVAATASVGAAAVVTLVLPAAVGASAAVGAPTITTSSTVTPATVAAVGDVGGFDGVVVDATVTPTAVAAVGTVPTVTITGDIITAVTPATVSAVASVGTPAVAGSFNVARSTAAVTARRTSTTAVTARRTSTAPVTARRTSTATVG